MGVDGAGGLASDHRSHYVANRDSLGAFLLSLALRRQRIGGFTRRREHHPQGVPPPETNTISEFTAVNHLQRKGGRPLRPQLSRPPRGAPSAAPTPSHASATR